MSGCGEMTRASRPPLLILLPLCLVIGACEPPDRTGNAAQSPKPAPAASPETAGSAPAASTATGPAPVQIPDGSSGYVWQVHADSAFYTIPDSEWDFAIVCKADDNALQFMTQNIDAAPAILHDDLEVAGVRRQLPGTFDPEGLGLFSSRIDLRDQLVTKLASGLTMLRIHNDGGETAQIMIPAEVAAMIATCRAQTLKS